MDDVGGRDNSEGRSSISGCLGSKVISLGGLNGGLINGDYSTIAVANKAKVAVVVGVGTIGVGTTCVAVASLDGDCEGNDELPSNDMLDCYSPSLLYI